MRGHGIRPTRSMRSVYDRRDGCTFPCKTLPPRPAGMAWSVGESRLPGHQSGSLRCGHRRTAGRPPTEEPAELLQRAPRAPQPPVCGGTIGRLALQLFLPTFFPACPSDAVEIVALHETVWRLDGLFRHGPGRLAMMGASVRFRVPAPKTWAPAIPAHPTRA